MSRKQPSTAVLQLQLLLSIKHALAGSKRYFRSFKIIHRPSDVITLKITVCYYAIGDNW
eukprot:SAG31_NODE_39585_length_287_cov_0.813830_1_plen_58_part_01